jgi:hypothetical protein
MGFRFHRSIKLFSGLRVNISKKGVGLSLGPRGAKLNIGPRGIGTTYGIPGTGLSYSKRVEVSPNSKGHRAPPRVLLLLLCGAFILVLATVMLAFALL